MGTLAARARRRGRASCSRERALYWPRERTLFVADVHLGKAAAFRAGGVPLPRGATAAISRASPRWSRATGAAALVVLGDFLHAAAGRVAALDAAFARWRGRARALAITLVRGNHDARAGDPPAAWRVDVVADAASRRAVPAVPRAARAADRLRALRPRASRRARRRRRPRFGAPALLRARPPPRPAAGFRAADRPRARPARAGETMVAIAGARCSDCRATACASPAGPARLPRRARRTRRPFASSNRQSRRRRCARDCACIQGHLPCVRDATARVTTRWTTGGKIVDMPRTPRKALFLLSFWRPYSCASKSACQSRDLPTMLCVHQALEHKI